MKYDSYYNFFMNLASETRMKIIGCLMEGPMTVTEIAGKTGEEQSNVSHNLVSLRGCRLVDVKRRGKERLYSLNSQTTLPILKLVEKHVKTYCRSGRCTKHDV